MDDYKQIETVVPEIEQFVGTSGVDIREIAARFPGANYAIDLVNNVNSSLLENITYVYNSEDSGSFGVFNPNLNETIDWVRVKNELESKGYTTHIPESPGRDDRLYAHAPGKTAEEITEEMMSIFQQKQQEGGNVIGISSEKIMDAANQMIGTSGGELSPQDEDNLRTVQLASIIAHEAAHARGADEGAAQSVQNDILQRGINLLNVPVELTGGTIHAGASNWYKKSQIVPFQWKLIEPYLRTHQERNSILFPVEKEKHDSVETMLDKNQHASEEEKKDKQTYEETFNENREEDGSVSVEKLLNDKRIHPLIIQIPKAAEAEKLIKTAAWSSNIGGPYIGAISWFGYLNGFNDSWRHPFEGDEISDTPNLAERPGEYYWRRRYDPRFGRGGMSVDRMGHTYWKWDFQVDLASGEFRNRPRPFYDRDQYWPSRSDIGVAGAGKSSSYNPSDDNIKNYIVQILRKIGYYKNQILSGKRKAIRIVLIKDALQHALDAAAGFPYVLFSHQDKPDKFILWLAGNVEASEIEEVEKDIGNGSNLEKVNLFAGLNERIKDSINKILSKCRLICREHGIIDAYVVGGFARTLASTKNMLEVNDLDFSASRPESCLKLGGLLAADLGVIDVGYLHRTMTMTFEYEGIKMDFRGSFISLGARELLRQYDIKTTPLNFDIYARDFTINSLVYSFMDNKIYDVTGSGLNDLRNKAVRTFFPAEVTVPLNPLIVTRAIILNLRGYSMSQDLDVAMREHAHRLFESGLTEERLAYEYEKISGYGEDGQYLLEEYGLTELKQIRDKVAEEQPELFEEE